MSVPGKLEATIKISELPTSEAVENGWLRFTIDCEGREVSTTVKPKVWKKLTTANEQYESWVAAITGRIGELTPEGFILENPNIQAFERKSKAAKPSEES
ncbi:MAG: fertility inhibition FinO-like protein [Leptolyngbya foveolarum]|uniref:Fertility inhibition FinO-like protein n=1 Tax=Leptolyngbya foveolarum TaxID=47253 RepID=A0A2W4UIX3_9CYAN|nr:MAG: fertility inhibition FinO-like protein [Leptolyngbya foveolarum]